MLGNNHNKLIFLKTCRTLVRLNRNETINIDRLIRNIKAKNCKWIQIEANNSYNRTLVIRNYLSKLIYILHKHLTCPLLWYKPVNSGHAFILQNQEIQLTSYITLENQIGTNWKGLQIRIYPIQIMKYQINQ